MRLRVDHKRHYIKEQANYLRNQLALNNIPFLDSNSHIVPVMTYKSSLAKAYSKKLLEQFRIYVQPIFYPTVPKNEARLRFTITPKHTKKDINELISALAVIYNLKSRKESYSSLPQSQEKISAYG